MRQAILAALLLAAPPAAAQEAMITLFCSGAFPGGGSGEMVDAAGHLYRLRQAGDTAPREVTPVGGAPAPLARWQALLDAARFDSLPPGEVANLTCTLTRRSQGREHSIRWQPTGVVVRLPPEVRQVMEELRAAAR